ncbi:MAG TPA: bifunctional nuclease family protein [Thermomicrobiales bacterium]|nr:bifunctional nuclease family protein [Thermomicrobiales bacterium]
MIETTVESIRVSLVTQNRVVILKEIDGVRHLPIWIGAYEAEAIAMELQGIAPTRPLPYDLFRTMLAEVGATIDRVVISDLNEQVFYARILIIIGGRTIEIDSRPSDAIAIAVRTNSRILVEDSIMEQAGVSLDDDESDATDLDRADSEDPAQTEPISPSDARGGQSAQDDRLSVFREFINSLDLDDFDRRKSN